MPGVVCGVLNIKADVNIGTDAGCWNPEEAQIAYIDPFEAAGKGTSSGCPQRGAQEAPTATIWVAG